MSWYAFRSVYLFGIKLDGTNVFEERVVCFEASGWQEALTKASKESDAYALENNCTCHPQHSGYEQDGNPLVDGYEIWSELYESPLDLDAFYADRYARFEFHPE